MDEPSAICVFIFGEETGHKMYKRSNVWAPTIPEEKEGCFLYYSRKRPMDDIPEDLTAIWSCTNDSCNGWMRDNFAFLNQPTCVQCTSLMVKSEKMLSIVANTSPNQSKH